MGHRRYNNIGNRPRPKSYVKKNAFRSAPAVPTKPPFWDYAFSEGFLRLYFPLGLHRNWCLDDFHRLHTARAPFDPALTTLSSHLDSLFVCSAFAIQCKVSLHVIAAEDKTKKNTRTLISHAAFLGLGMHSVFLY